MTWDKTALFAAWAEHLDAQLAGLLDAQGAAREGTRVDEGHRPENRGERAAVTARGYLANALGERVGALEVSRQQMAGVEPSPRSQVVVGAIVLVEDEDGERAWYAVLPGGQGDQRVQGGRTITIVSPRAPVAAALRGLEAGDVGAYERRGEEIEVEVVEVS